MPRAPSDPIARTYASPQAALAEAAALERRGDLAGAAEILGGLLERWPDDRDGLFLFARLFRRLGRPDTARDLLEALLKAHPGFAEGWAALGLALTESGRSDEAPACWRRALAEDPFNPEALFELANRAHRADRFAEALQLYNRLLAGHPGLAGGWLNLALCRKLAGAWAASERACRRAIALEPDAADAHFNLSHLLLQQGRFAEGWVEYEWRRRLPGFSPYDWTIPEWTGREPAGTTLLLWQDQGFGDAVMFLRHVQDIAARGHRVLLLVKDELVGLAASVPGVAAALPLSGPRPAADRHLPLGSLPLRLGLLEPAPSWKGPYIFTPPMPIEAPVGTRRIGLVWAGNRNHPNDARRSAPLAAMAPLFALPGITWFSLQIGPGTAELANSPWAGQVRDLSPRLADFTATAAAVAGLDLLIAVDTAVVHVAGALGRPAWVLLPGPDCDWRWRTEGEDTDWYPRVRLFRQAEEGGWTSLVGRVAAALKVWRQDGSLTGE